MFYDILNRILEKNLPKRIKSSSKYPIWFSNKIIKGLKLKSKYHTLYKKFGYTCHENQYKELRKRLKNDIKLAYQNYIQHVEDDIINEPTAFWNFMKNKKSTNKMPSTFVYNGREIQNGQEIADTFAEFFKSTFDNSKINPPFTGYFQLNSDLVSLNEISKDDIIEAINKLKPKKSLGPDNVPSYILKGCKEILASPLCYLFNLSIKNKTFPSAFKTTTICPIFKSGNKNDILNYRPIALISNIAKLYESILYKYIFSSVQSQISQYQHGFFKGRSSATNLLNFVNETHQAFESFNQMDVIYLDAAKAFDKVPHNILLNKLHHFFNFSEDLTALISSYLKNRPAKVKIEQFFSETYIATSGVPQGSNLGPLLFLLYVNDVEHSIQESKFLMYADDIKLFKAIERPNDVFKLQNDINNLVSWSKHSGLSFNFKKFKCFTFSRKRNTLYHDYNINNEPLERVTHYKDLGVIFDSKLSFDEHIETTLNSSFKSLGFVCRNSIHFKNLSTFHILFNTFIRSKLEYCAIVWSPYYKKNINRIERIQKKYYHHCNYYLKYPPLTSYSELLNIFQLETLEDRRIHLQFSFLYKVLNGLVADSTMLQSIQLNVPRFNSRTTCPFSLKYQRTNYMISSPLYSMQKLYNECTKNSSIDIFGDSLRCFKSKLFHLNR